MDSNHKDDQEIKDLLKNVKMVSPPAKLSEGFENEVLDRIHAGEGKPVFPMASIAAPALALCLVLAIFLWPAAEVEKTQPEPLSIPVVEEVPNAVTQEELKEKVDAALADMSEDQIENLAEELELFEALGEDMSFLDEFGFDMMEIEILSEVMV